MGENVTDGSLIYNVIQSDWKGQLGSGLDVRTPQRRFLEITLSITNSGGQEASVPLLHVQDSAGNDYVESDSGNGVDNWLGLLRSISPAQTLQGKILFDVPLASYRLRLTDGAGAGIEKFAWVTVPLRLDADSGVETPVPDVNPPR